MKLGRPPTHPLAGRTGAVLGTERIQQLLQEGWLFANGTWREDQLRPAGYELVIARDDLRVPDRDDPTRLIHYPPGTPFPDSALYLEPGDFAYVTTREQLCLPWTVAGNVGVRNRFARKGLLVLTGLLVDPGYGLTAAADDWEKRPQRLHFGIANVGHIPVNIVFEQDAIATIQFIVVDGDVLMEEIVLSEAAAGERGFRLFRDFEDDLQAVRTQAKATEASTQAIVIFGLFVLLATFVGAVTAIVLGAVGNNTLSDRLNTVLQTVSDHPTAAWEVSVVLGAIAFIIAGVVMWPISRLLLAGRRRAGDETNRRRRFRGRRKDA